MPETLRGRGIGTDLLRRAEAEALVRGCHGAWLDTFEFQARGFYERLGYRCFGELGGSWRLEALFHEEGVDRLICE